MPFFLTLGIIDTKSDPTVDLIKKELARATTIKREAPIVSGDADDVAIDVDVNVGVDIGDVGAPANSFFIRSTVGSDFVSILVLILVMLVLKVVVSMLMMLVVYMVDSPLSVDIPHRLLLLLVYVLHHQYQHQY